MTQVMIAHMVCEQNIEFLCYVTLVGDCLHTQMWVLLEMMQQIMMSTKYAHQIGM